MVVVDKKGRCNLLPNVFETAHAFETDTDIPIIASRSSLGRSWVHLVIQNPSHRTPLS